MSRTFFWISIFFCFSLTPAISQFHHANHEDTTVFTDTEKLMLFDINKKEYSTAFLLTLTFSGAGHIYTGNWDEAVGLLPLKGVLIGVRQKTNNNRIRDYSSAAILLVFLWELMDVSEEVTKYNEQLFSQLTGKPLSFKLRQRNDEILMTLTVPMSR